MKYLFHYISIRLVFNENLLYCSFLETFITHSSSIKCKIIENLTPFKY